MAIVYRDTHEIDLDQLAALFRVAGMRADDRPRLAQQVRGARFVISACDGEQLVGFARAISDGVSNAYVSTVAVLPEYRGRGIAREMLRRLLDGRDGITFALHARQEAKALYLSCGFVNDPNMFRRVRRF